MANGVSLIIGAYIIGAIPFGLIIGKLFYQTDIRQHGSKNPGATNVWRTLGKVPGITTLLLDIVKGFLPVFIGKTFLNLPLGFLIGAGLAAIIGHNWSIFLMGKGGKGVATSAGVFLALVPKQMGITLIVFLLFFLSTKHVSVGSMAAAVALLAATFVFPTEMAVQILVGVASIMILVKHIPNMKRLKRGEEPKVKL